MSVSRTHSGYEFEGFEYKSSFMHVGFAWIVSTRIENDCGALGVPEFKMELDSNSDGGLSEREVLQLTAFHYQKLATVLNQLASEILYEAK